MHVIRGDTPGACAVHVLNTRSAQYACSMSQARHGQLQDHLIARIACPSTTFVLNLSAWSVLCQQRLSWGTQLGLLQDSCCQGVLQALFGASTAAASADTVLHYHLGCYLCVVQASAAGGHAPTRLSRCVFKLLLSSCLHNHTQAWCCALSYMA
jgi:hypothetical protein